ncbi:hypothetical protein ACFOZ5_05230 [Marinobacter lacisalsi]|uniref:Uncharacterized protein n=1 Tax=Marinobacter lacisalsi TaxID=475979 RepID=A0ABV8QFA5_9GAMM
MSWFKIFSAVVVANIVSWVIVSIIGLVFWVYVLGQTADAVSQALRDVEIPSVRFDSPSTNSSTGTSQEAQRRQEEIQEQLQQAAADRARREREERDRQGRIAAQRRTCNYWTQELREDGDADSREYQKLACDRLQRMIRSQ